ncbi:hypothetical protein BH09PLA1_BH09PLA1_08410 [soil metagenome]
MSAEVESPRRPFIWTIALVLIFFSAVAPTLRWLEFSNSMENLNVGTALEIRRGGPRLVPTLEGRRRIEKPPLTAWITSLGIRPSTLSRLDEPDPAARAQAYQRLAFDVRWTALLAACFTLLATYALARSVADARTGLVAVAICASCYFFLRFSRFAMTDVQLMLWVTIANVFLARMVLDGVTWRNSLCGGAAIGLAFMSKGPVAFVLSLLPAIVFVGMRMLRQRHDSGAARRPIKWSAVIGGAAVLLIVGLWWFALVGAQDHEIVKTWLSETNPAGGERTRSDNPVTYLLILPFMLPWAAYIVDRCGRAVAAIAKSSHDDDWRAAYPVVFLIVALLVMSCFTDRKDRYLLPLVPMAALVAAQSAMRLLQRRKDALPDWSHWGMLIIFGLLPVLGATTIAVKNASGLAWYSRATAIAAATGGLAIVTLGFVISRRWRAVGMIGSAFLLMMFLQVIGILGYATSREGRSEFRPLAELIRRDYPDAEMYNWRADGQAKRASVDLSIYLNRITRWIPDPAALPRSDRPQIYVKPQDKGDPDPEPAPGWKFLHKMHRDKGWYVAFVRKSS